MEKTPRQHLESERTVTPEEVPILIKQEFKRHKDSLAGEVRAERATIEDAGSGITRYRLFCTLRNEDTKILSGATPFGHLLNDFRKEFTITVDEKTGEIINSESSEPVWNDRKTTIFS